MVCNSRSPVVARLGILLRPPKRSKPQEQDRDWQEQRFRRHSPS